MGLGLAPSAYAGPWEDGSAAYVKGDYATAARLYKLAADQGHAKAQYNLGNMYALGDGVTQDYILAHMWFNLAASSLEGPDGKTATTNRDLAAGRMTAANFQTSGCTIWLPHVSNYQTTDNKGNIMTHKNPRAEPIIDPELPIVDAHHHLWYRPEGLYGGSMHMEGLFPEMTAPITGSFTRYLLEEFLADLNSGHNVTATVFAETGAMYRANGPVEMKSVGEVEFANGVGAMAASGLYGKARVCAGIVGYADLLLGDSIQDVLQAQIDVGGSRYRGIRYSSLYDPEVWSSNKPRILADEKFRSGFKWLNKLGLSFDAAVLETQLPELVDLARCFPDTPIILNHLGMPLGVGRFAGKREERFPIWRDHMRTLSNCDNVIVKLSGLGIPIFGFDSFMSTPPFTSEKLAVDWRPYIDTCIEIFGADRCMFASNFPIDSGTCTYPVLWNTFKRVTAGATKEEKSALFSGTAARVYRLDI